MVEDLGFCLGLTDARRICRPCISPSAAAATPTCRETSRKITKPAARGCSRTRSSLAGVYITLSCSRANRGFSPANDPSISIRYGGVPKNREEKDLSGSANKILKVLRKEWEMGSADLRAEAGITTRPRFTKALDKLQRTMKVVPQEVLYVPKFTYIWTLAEARFPEELSIKMPRDEAVHELARAYLEMCGMTLLGELSGKLWLFRGGNPERRKSRVVDEGFAERSRNEACINCANI